MISIGVPVYNGEKYITDTLDSLLKQTYKDIDVIISDNASSDKTGEICERFSNQDPRIRYFRQENNIGAIPNFKFVFNEARGDYFMWAAADDLLDTRWIEVLLPIAKKFDCMAYGKLVMIDQNGTEILHPASGKTYSFIGNPLARRIKYFSEPPFLGKANPIYSIFPRKFVSGECLDVYKNNLHGWDLLFLFDVLKRTEIRANGHVKLYKRLQKESHEPMLLQHSKFKKALSLIKVSIGAPLLSKYLPTCSILEKILLIVVYPWVVLKNIFMHLNYYLHSKL